MTPPLWVGCHPDNFRVGRNGAAAKYVVIHLTAGGMPDGWFGMGLAQRQAAFNAQAAAQARSTGRPVTPIHAEVSSANFGVSKFGERKMYVKEADTAFHAGISPRLAQLYPPTVPWYTLGMDVNAASFGIEHEGVEADIWPDAQVRASAELIAALATRYNIPIDRTHVVGHHEIWAGHTCPGPHCPLDRLIQMAQQIQGAQPLS